MTYWQEGYSDGAYAAQGRAYRVAPGGRCADYQRGWRHGFDDECRARDWVSVEIAGDGFRVSYGRKRDM